MGDRMSYITLNHAPRSIEQPFRLAILIFGTLFFIAAVLFAQHVYRKAALTHTALTTLSESVNSDAQHRKTKRVALRNNDTNTDAKSEERLAVNRAIADISLPWHSLFSTIEFKSAANTANGNISTGDADVQLLAIEPNMQQKHVRLTAVAFNKQAMFAYLNALSNQPLLKNVVLVSQENTDIQGEPAIHFVLEAIW